MRTNTRVKIVPPYEGPLLGKFGTVVAHQVGGWGDAIIVEVDGWGQEWFSETYLEVQTDG